MTPAVAKTQMCRTEEDLKDRLLAKLYRRGRPQIPKAKVFNGSLNPAIGRVEKK